MISISILVLILVGMMMSRTREEIDRGRYCKGGGGQERGEEEQKLV